MDSVAYDMDAFDLLGQGVYQWFLPDTPVVLFTGHSQPAPSSYVISSGDWARRHPDRPAVPLWSDPGRDQTLWRLASG